MTCSYDVIKQLKNTKLPIFFFCLSAMNCFVDLVGQKCRTQSLELLVNPMYRQHATNY